LVFKGSAKSNADSNGASDRHCADQLAALSRAHLAPLHAHVAHCAHAVHASVARMRFVALHAFSLRTAAACAAQGIPAEPVDLRLCLLPFGDCEYLLPVSPTLVAFVRQLSAPICPYLRRQPPPPARSAPIVVRTSRFHIGRI
jgi:hypothetical protein